MLPHCPLLCAGLCFSLVLLAAPVALAAENHHSNVLLETQRRLRESKAALEEANRVTAERIALPAHLGAVRRDGAFWVDEAGRPVALEMGVRPQGEERRPESHRQKLARHGIALPASRGSLRPRAIPVKPEAVVADERVDPTKVLFKFTDGEPVRLRSGRLASQGRTADTWDSIFSRYPEAEVLRAFTTEERILDENRETGQVLSGGELPDLNNWYLAQFPAGSTRGAALANELLALAAIETAYLESNIQNAICLDQAPATPPFETSQTYRGPAPDGLDSDFANDYHPGGNGFGAGYWIVDCEQGWCTTFEDLPITALDVLNGQTVNEDPNIEWANTQHGTAVLGIYGACANDYGMTGMTPDVRLKMADFNSEPTLASNVALAESVLDPGEIILIEVQIDGPESFTLCQCNCLQYEDVPLEWDQASFDAISTATANGMIVVEPAGNGSMDLDHSRYENKFQKWFRDSGAIMVAATDNDHERTCWTNHGSRIDVHAFGNNDVITTGYGDLWIGEAACDQSYTYMFGGTSSASPMIVGAVAALQGITKAKWGYTMWPSVMRDRIDVGGVPSPDTGVGLMPDLEAAIHGLEPDWYPDSPGNWPHPAVPRAVGDATFTNAPLLPSPLPGDNPDCRDCETYFNWASRLSPNSLFGSVVGARTALRLDDEFMWECLGGGQSPGSYQYCLNVEGTAKGGRHTVNVESDYLDQETEGNEANNNWYRQFIWDGYELDEGESYITSADPPASTSGAIWYNAEGIEGVRLNGHWHAFAVLPSHTLDDMDVRLNTEVPLNIPLQGFGAHVSWSSDGPGNSDFVLVDATELGTGTSWGSLLWLEGPGADRRVQFQRDEGTLTGTDTWGPFTLATPDILNLHELWLEPGTYEVTIAPQGGTANVGISVYPGTGGRFAKDEALGNAYADDVAGFGGETVGLRIMVHDRYALAVWKSGAADVAKTLTYTVTVQESETVDAPAVVEVPAVLALAPPSPNPSRGAAAIAYDVPAGGSPIDLAVYDLSGRRVAELVRGFTGPGRHRVEWDGRDSSGRIVADGIYFVRMEARNASFTRKIARIASGG